MRPYAPDDTVTSLLRETHLRYPQKGVRLSEVFSRLTVAGSESDPVKRMYSTDPAAPRSGAV